MTIRAMTAADLQAVSELEADCFSQPWRFVDFEDALKKDHYYFLVAEEEGRLVGQAGLIISFEEADITNVAVRPGSRGQGVATSILRQLIEDGMGKGVTAFTLEVRESNQAAIGLYKKLGFATEGIRRDFYEKPRENALIMWKRKM